MSKFIESHSLSKLLLLPLTVVIYKKYIFKIFPFIERMWYLLLLVLFHTFKLIRCYQDSKLFVNLCTRIIWTERFFKCLCSVIYLLSTNYTTCSVIGNGQTNENIKIKSGAKVQWEHILTDVILKVSLREPYCVSFWKYLLWNLIVLFKSEEKFSSKFSYPGSRFPFWFQYPNISNAESSLLLCWQVLFKGFNFSLYTC